MNTEPIPFDTIIKQCDAAVTTYSVDRAKKRVEQDGSILVDIRDVRELEREGRIAGAKHVPRGMLEFWMHPQSPYYREYLGEAKEVILYCNRGWRSAVAASQLNDIGITASHMDGGFAEWQEKGWPVEEYKRNP